MSTEARGVIVLAIAGLVLAGLVTLIVLVALSSSSRGIEAATTTTTTQSPAPPPPLLDSAGTPMDIPPEETAAPPLPPPAPTTTTTTLPPTTAPLPAPALAVLTEQQCQEVGYIWERECLLPEEADRREELRQQAALYTTKSECQAAGHAWATRCLPAALMTTQWNCQRHTDPPWQWQETWQQQCIPPPPSRPPPDCSVHTDGGRLVVKGQCIPPLDCSALYERVWQAVWRQERAAAAGSGAAFSEEDVHPLAEAYWAGLQAGDPDTQDWVASWPQLTLPPFWETDLDLLAAGDCPEDSYPLLGGYR